MQRSASLSRPGRPSSRVETTHPITWAGLVTAPPQSVSSCGVILRSPPQLSQCEKDDRAEVRHKPQESMRTVLQVRIRVKEESSMKLCVGERRFGTSE